MTLSFNPSNSSDSLSLVAGLTADKGAKNGGFPGVGSFMELLKALEQIEPRDDTSTLFSAVEADGRTAQDLPTGKDLPGGLPVLQDGVPVLPEGDPEPAASGSSEPLAKGNAAKVIPFPGVSPEVAQSAPIPSGDIAIAPPKQSTASNTKLAPAAASPIASPLVLADRSVDAAAIPASGVPKASAAAVLSSSITQETATAGSDPKPNTVDRAARNTRHDAHPAPKGEGVQVSIQAKPELRNALTGGPAIASLPIAEAAKPQSDAKRAANSEGLHVRVSALPPVRLVGVAPTLPTLTEGRAVETPQLSSKTALASSSTSSIARVELQAVASSVRSEPTSETDGSTSLPTGKPTLAIQAQGSVPSNPTTTPRPEGTTQALTRTDAPSVGPNSPAPTNPTATARPEVIAQAPVAEQKAGDASTISDHRNSTHTKTAVSVAGQARAERPEPLASVAPTPRTALVANPEEKQSAPSPVSAKSKEPGRSNTAPLIQPTVSTEAKTAEKANLTSRTMPSAELAKPNPQSIAAPIEAISNPVRPITAPATPTSIDTFADVERVVEQIMSARQVDLSKPASVAVAHREFGALTLTFDQQASGKMNVEIASEDGDVQRALAAAIAQDRGSSRNGELGAQLSQSNSQPAPTMSDRGGSFGSSGSASGQSNTDDNRSQNSAQRDPHGERAASRHQFPAQHPSDDALYA